MPGRRPRGRRGLCGNAASDASARRPPRHRCGQAGAVEKAFTMNADEARHLVAAARAEKLFLMEAMWTRFLPHMIEVRRLVADGRLGHLVMVSADHGQWFDK